jgi:hypothetical protein
MWPQALSLLSFSSSSQFVNQLIIGLHYNCTELWEKLLNLEGGQLSPNNEAFFFCQGHIYDDGQPAAPAFTKCGVGAGDRHGRTV